jgi:hypothetical protein
MSAAKAMIESVPIKRSEEEARKTVRQLARDSMLNNLMQRELALVNSWNLSNDESAFMWKMYSSNEKGVAIQSTFDKLCRSFTTSQDEPVYVGQVQYHDFRDGWKGKILGIETIMFKRSSFSCDNEVRALTFLPQEELWSQLEKLTGQNMDQ